MTQLEVFSWNPRRARLPRPVARRLPKRLRIGRKVDNFDNLLGPFLVERILARHGVEPHTARPDCRLLSVSPVLHFACDHDVIWGKTIVEAVAMGGERAPTFAGDRLLDAFPLDFLATT